MPESATILAFIGFIGTLQLATLGMVYKLIVKASELEAHVSTLCASLKRLEDRDNDSG